jgi:hypothetical protein
MRVIPAWIVGIQKLWTAKLLHPCSLHPAFRTGVTR